MKKVMLVILILLLTGPVVARDSPEDKQANLDAACEVARD